MNKWTSGYCSAFAEALKRLFGGELWAIVDHSRTCPKPEDDNLIHAYCVIDGVAYDAEGGHSVDKVSDVSDYEPDDMDRDNDVVFQWRQVDSAWFSDCHEDYESGMQAIDEAIQYIKRKRKLFGHLKPLNR